MSMGDHISLRVSGFDDLGQPVWCIFAGGKNFYLCQRDTEK